jgi:HAD superfamily hydrolase (TIGR01509 family)
MVRAGNITHVIYDMDGLLLNTEPFYTEVNQYIAAKYGRVFDWDVKSRTIGLKARDSARVLIDTLGLPITVSEYLEMRKHKLDELFPKSEPMPGAVRLTEHLHRHGIPQAVATSSDRRNLELKTSRVKPWFGLFDCVVTGDDPRVRKGKPAPDTFLVAAEHMNAPPERCLVFEDAPSGVEAARAAGMHVVSVYDPNLDPGVRVKADQDLRTLEEFNPSDWGLPGY